MDIITSRTNPLCTHFRKLASSRSYRERSGECLCDSPKLLTEALTHGAAVHTVVATPSVTLPPLPEGVRAVQGPEDVMASVSPAQTPQGVLSVCPMTPQSAPAKLEGAVYMVLDGVQDPGNVGTILRTAHAFGFDDVILSPGCADLYNEKVIRSTQGALFHMNCVQRGLREAMDELRKQDVRIYATALHHDAIPLSQLHAPSRFALIFGNEGQGVEEALIAASDAALYIEMAQFESLNVAVAAAICMYTMSH